MYVRHYFQRYEYTNTQKKLNQPSVGIKMIILCIIYKVFLSFIFSLLFFPSFTSPLSDYSFDKIVK